MHLVESLRYNFNKFLRRYKNSRIWAKYGDATRYHFSDDSRIVIGDYTYGVPTIYRYDKQVKLFIGKYCSIAKGVEILLGGCHHTDWCSTYPFYSKNTKIFSNAKGYKDCECNDTVIGNDVWIGKNALILE